MNNKKIVYGLLILLAIIAIGVIIKWVVPSDTWHRAKTDNLVRSDLKNDSGTEANMASTTPAEATTTPATGSSTSVSNKGKPPVVDYSYDQAVKHFGGLGYRIQLSKCHGTPGKLAIKTGTQFMIDNRDGVWHEVQIASQKFKVSGWGFVIVTAKEMGVYNITCDGGGAAELNVQK